MLNISENSINEHLDIRAYKTFTILLGKNRVRRMPLFIGLLLFVGALLSLFLPWTQNISAKGYVTTLLPEQRPQAIQSVISGRLEKWYVREGDYVDAGDTIIFISEIKNDYFDPDLVARTGEQVEAKAQSIVSYDDKVKALQQQYRALESAQKLKIEQTQNKILQTQNKIKIDSTDLVAFEVNLQIAENQYSRIKELYDKGLKSLSELQEKELKLQQTQAKVTVQSNKLQNQKNELLNLYIELTAIEQEYADKLAKSQSDRQTALSNKLEAMAATSKLQNQLSNYSARQEFYYVTAPQSGYITKSIKKGIGEIIKEGTDVVTIMPANYELAVEIYVKPQDLPLLEIGNEVRLRFDGWPAIIISGWPEASTGIFTGEVVAIDRFVSDNGAYRLLIKDKPKEKSWPLELRVGTGVNTFLLLKDVPIWYEIWRQLNGFPPDFYEKDTEKQADIKRKAPLKSVK